MITKDDISKKDMIAAINELESIHRVYEAKNEDNWSEEDYPKGFCEGQGEILHDIGEVLDTLRNKIEQKAKEKIQRKQYKKPEIVK